MITKTFKIEKTGRVWIQATQNGYNCKIKMSELTKDLTGEVTLLVEDISVRSKYGTDLRYEMVSDNKKSEKVFFSHGKYNCFMVAECRELGGQWDSESKTWAFNAIVEDKIEELEELYNCDLIDVELTAKEDCSYGCDAVDFLGYTIARATGRDSGAQLGDGVSMLRGSIDSGGSMKNWRTSIEEKSIFRLSVPKNLLKASNLEKNRFFSIQLL